MRAEPRQVYKLFWRDPETNKDREYQMQIVPAGKGKYTVDFRFGRRGTSLTGIGTKTPKPVELEEARDIFGRLYREKTGKGYTEKEPKEPGGYSRRTADEGSLKTYVVTTTDGGRHTIQAENQAQATRIAHQRFGYYEIADPPREVNKTAHDADPGKARVYTVTAPEEVLDRFEQFLAFVQRNAAVGHSTVCGFSIDGDGADRFEVKETLPEIGEGDIVTRGTGGEAGGGFEMVRANDSAKRARLHRALDCAIDTRRARDKAAGIKDAVNVAPMPSLMPSSKRPKRAADAEKDPSKPHVFANLYSAGYCKVCGNGKQHSLHQSGGADAVSEPANEVLRHAAGINDAAGDHRERMHAALDRAIDARRSRAADDMVGSSRVFTPARGKTAGSADSDSMEGFDPAESRPRQLQPWEDARAKK